MNRKRTVEAVQELTMRQKLCALASIRAEECVQNLSADRPDGRTWSSILTDYGYTGWSHKAEIRMFCSKGLPASILVDTWMSTDSSKTDILFSEHRYCGIGIAYNGSTMYIVAIFTG